MNWKEIYTKAILEEKDMEVNDASIREHLQKWWVNTRNRGKAGLRLSDDGLAAVDSVKIELFHIDYPPSMKMTPQVILFLDKFLDCPYFLKKDGIIVLDSQRAIELTLYSGDVHFYGETKARNRAKKNRVRHEVYQALVTHRQKCRDFKRYYRELTGEKYRY